MCANIQTHQEQTESSTTKQHTTTGNNPKHLDNTCLKPLRQHWRQHIYHHQKTKQQNWDKFNNKSKEHTQNHCDSTATDMFSRQKMLNQCPPLLPSPAHTLAGRQDTTMAKRSCAALAHASSLPAGHHIYSPSSMPRPLKSKMSSSSGGPSKAVVCWPVV